jgi:hypothetical protein
MLTLRQFNIGPPVYAHLRDYDYDVLEDGQSIGRLREGAVTSLPSEQRNRMTALCSALQR